MTGTIGKLLACLNRQTEVSDHAQIDFNVYCDYSFGKTFGFLDKEEDYHNLIATVDARGEVLNTLGHLPKCRECYQRRGAGDEQKDLLWFLFKAKDPETGQPLPEQELIAESNSFIVGGSDTTSKTSTDVVDTVSHLPNI
ncbi:cytochrome P450 [Penicillium maclennaniae]|uniref:cytochrome P450 n=1 Tax=Penicillium maclennaniae TaxID=1343394 RepID=UPI00253F6FBC|nr:cytochrome P450 [Penicillium maclennaniae]KAJ5668274.1 cytochrome P450 [Penicillium maclennaniae]